MVGHFGVLLVSGALHVAGNLLIHGGLLEFHQCRSNGSGGAIYVDGDVLQSGEQWKKGPWLFRLCRGWKTTQLYEDFNKPIRCLGGGQLKYCLFSTRKLGKMNPFWRAYFSNGLVETTVCFRPSLWFFFQIFGLGAWGMFIQVPHPVCFLFCLLGMLDSYLKGMPDVLYPG